MTGPTSGTPRADSPAARGVVPDYEQTYNAFWRDIVENPDGTLNRDQIMRELHDYHGLLDEIPKVYDDITGGRISKPNTAAHHVIAEVEERTQEAIKEALGDIADVIEAEPSDPGSDYKRGLNVAAKIVRGEAT